MATKKDPASTGATIPEGASDNTRIWDALCKTDPAQTKSFQRSGGFRGTAIKPIWTTLRMTELFGPCGIGWGMDKPEFITERAGDELFVFCTVGLWYVDNEARGQVYGVGGDQVATKGSSGIRTSDEAFKKAYTDAMGNAMKQIGMAADVHMGLFDDAKYVQEVAGEYSQAHAAAAQSQDAPALPPLPEVDETTAIRIIQAIESAKTVEAIGDIVNGTSKAEMKALHTNRPNEYARILTAASTRKTQLQGN